VNLERQILDRAFPHCLNYMQFHPTFREAVTGRMTIGYEHEDKRLPLQTIFSYDKAKMHLRKDLAAAMDLINRTVEAKYLTHTQTIGLVLFVKDLKEKAWRASAVRRSLNANDPLKAAVQMLKSNKVVIAKREPGQTFTPTRVSQALTMRRQTQARIFCNFPIR
jgi:GH24 family phage-related lysozyme (muramidase)